MEWTTILNKQNGRFLKRFVARLSRFGLVVAVSFFLTWKPLFAQGTDGAAESEPKSAGFMEIVFSGGVTGALIMVTLIALSIITAYLVIDHFLTVRRKDLMPSGLDEEVKNLLAHGKVEEAQQRFN